MADKNLQISIEAVDNAKKALDSVRKNLEGVTGEMKNVQKASDSQAMSVFKGVASWDLLKKSVGIATDFFRDSIKESMESARIMANVKTNVENAGFAYDTLAPKIKEAGDMAVKFGFDDEVASESLSKFLLVTKNMAQAQSLLALSMDLSRNKNIDLAEASRAITLVTQGNNRALKEYGIDLGDTATTADILTEAQKKLKGSMEAFSETTAGKLATLNQQWDNMKQQIGDGITPALADFATAVQDNMPAIIALFDAFAGAVATVVGWIGKLGGADLGNFNKKMTSLVDTQAELVKASIDSAQAGDKEKNAMLQKALAYNKAEQEVARLTRAKELLSNITRKSEAGVTGGQQNELSTLGFNVRKTGILVGGVSTEESNKMAKKALEEVNVALEKQNKLVEDNKKAYDSASGPIIKVNNSLAGLVNKSTSAKGGNDELKDSLKNLADEFDNLGESADDALFQIGEEHKSSLEDFKKQLADVRDEMSKTTASFNSQKNSDQMTVAGAVVANQERIAEIQKTLTGEVAKTEHATLEAELLQRQQDEINNASFIATIQAQIAEVKRVNALTDMQRAIEDYTTKRTMAETEYAENMARLKKEASEIKKQRDAEKALYQEKIAFIKELDAQASLEMKKTLDANLLVTKDAITKEIEYYKALAEAIKASRSGNSAEIGRIQSKVQSVKDAVISPSGDIITTDPNDYIIATKNPKGLGGGSTINIKIDTMIGTKEYAEEVGNLIVKELQMQSQL